MRADSRWCMEIRIERIIGIAHKFVSMRIRNLPLVAFFLAPAALLAQDAHYWTYQYGPRANLLGGAVIGSVSDVSATFYNPGALSLAEDLTFTIAADVFQIRSLTLENAAGEGVDLVNSTSGCQTLSRGRSARTCSEACWPIR